MDPDNTLGMSPVLGTGSSRSSPGSPCDRKKNVHYSINSYSGSYLGSPSNQPNHSTPIKPNQQSSKRCMQSSNNTLTEYSPKQYRTPSPVRKSYNRNSTRSYKHKSMRDESTLDSSSRIQSSFNKPSYISDLEASTVEKQHKELQLLIEELKNRDSELNEMVASHQKQLLAWEDDRQRLLALEQRALRLEKMLQEKTDELRGVSTKLKITESEEHSRSTVLRNTQHQLVQVTEQNSQTTLKLRELQEENEALRQTVGTTESSMEQLKARELELLSVCKSKDKDLRAAASHITELTGKLKHLDQQHRDCQGTQSNMKWQISEWKQKYIDTRKEMETLSKKLYDQKQEVEEEQQELGKLKQENSELKKELFAAGERDRRNSEFVELQKSSEDRLKAELATLRQLYERQQRELVLLRLNAESVQETQNQIEDDNPGTVTLSSGIFSMDHSAYSGRNGEFSKSTPPESFHSTKSSLKWPNKTDNAGPTSSLSATSQRLPERIFSAENSLNSTQSNSLSMSTGSRSSSINDSRNGSSNNYNNSNNSNSRTVSFASSQPTKTQDSNNANHREPKGHLTFSSDQNARLRSKSLERERTKHPSSSATSRSFEERIPSNNIQNSTKENQYCKHALMSKTDGQSAYTSKEPCSQEKKVSPTHTNSLLNNNLTCKSNINSNEIKKKNGSSSSSYESPSKEKLFLNNNHHGQENMSLSVAEGEEETRSNVVTPTQSGALSSSDHLFMMSGRDSFIAEVPESPASKLFKLIQESRQMVESLEQSN